MPKKNALTCSKAGKKRAAWREYKATSRAKKGRDKDKIYSHLYYHTRVERMKLLEQENADLKLKNLHLKQKNQRLAQRITVLTGEECNIEPIIDEEGPVAAA